MKLNNIQVIDLFAGPGGLGEGFSNASDDAFRIIVSAEKDQFAHQTLRLRAYYRQLLREAPDKLNVYLDFCNGTREIPWDESTQALWNEAGEEAKLIELGTESGNAELDIAIQQKLDMNAPWVLIGGPPCQAYSLVGRSRNKGKIDYKPEKDDKHFLYKEYLRIIQKYRPAIFVMENVKGILSSKINGELIFHSILKDLSDPDSAINDGNTVGRYRIYR
ncbi:DNA cytosine methyltransferase [Methylomicrobium agile]|uniref:DNA cytosine methyltransferase n=1 Tax=Methylomicrobium agile TaxID=39774 RepID=UPI00068E12A3|nr:DNA cytosine methyltransferase [Methylomicrobium agile]